MIALDTSAIVAVLRNEPEAGRIAAAMSTASRLLIGHPTAAFDRFGKGRHPASLTYGDCMAYTVAQIAGCLLLYKGEGFARTDIRSAL